MDSPSRDLDPTRKKKSKENDEDGTRSKSSLRRSFKWLLDRGNRKKNRPVKSEDEEDDRGTGSGRARSETVPDPDESGLDLFAHTPANTKRSERADSNDRDSSTDDEVDVTRHPTAASSMRDARSTPGRKRIAARSLAMTSDSSDSEVELNHLCGTSKGKGKKSSGKGKRKKGASTEERGGKGEGNRLKGKTQKVSLRRDDSGSDDDEFKKVLVQFHKSPSGDAIASTSGLRASNAAVIPDEEDDGGDVDAPMEEGEYEGHSRSNEDDEGESDATIMVVKRGKKSAGRTGSTWPRQSEAATTSHAAAGNVGSVAATHPRGRCNRPGVTSGDARNLIKSPSQKSGGGGGVAGGGSSGGDVEVRVRTTARGTSVSVLLPSAAAGSGNNEANTSASGRSSSSRDVRPGASSMQPSQTTTLQRRRQASGGRRNSLPVSAHHSVHSPPLPPPGLAASTTASSPDVTEEAPTRGNGALSQPSAASLASRRASIIQIDDDGDDEDDEDEVDDDVVLVEYERSSTTGRSGSRDFPDVIEEPSDDDARSGSDATSGVQAQCRSPDAVGVINQIDDDARLARQLQEEFDREMASSLAREMERERAGSGRVGGTGTDEESTSSVAGFGEDGVIVPGAPGPYYDIAARRRRLSRVLATASSHVGAVSRVPPARRRAGGGGGSGGGAFPLELSLGFGFGSPLSGVVGSDITAEDVEAILDGDDEDDSTNESSNDSDVLFDESRGSTSRGAISSAFDLVLGNPRSSRITSALRAEGRAASSSSARRGPRPSASIRRGVRSSSSPSVQNEGRYGEDEEEGEEEDDDEEPMDVDDPEGQRESSPHESAPTIASDAAPSAHAPRRSRRLQRGPATGLLSSAGGSALRAATSAARGVSAALTPLLTSSAQSTSLNDIVGVPLPGVTSTVQLSSSSTSVDRGPPAPSGPRGLLRGRLARANMTSSTPSLNTLGLPVTTSAASRGPLSTSRSPSRGPRTTRGRPRAVSDSREGENSEDGSSTATATDGASAEGTATTTAATSQGSAASCATCEGIQNRIQTYLQEVRALQDTPVEGYDANFERMRVTTHLMRQTNYAMREWRSHTTQSMHHSLEERTHRLNTMSAIYRQISEIIQGAVGGLSSGSLTSSRTRSRATRSSRENTPTTSAAGSSSSRTARGQRYPGESTNPQFQFRRARAPSHLMPRLFIGQLPPGRLISWANGWPADLDYEALLRLGDIMGDVVPQGLSQAQINRLPTHIFDKQKASASTSTSTGEREDHKQCHVCLTEYESGEQLRILPCFHRFHSACIDEWIKTNPTCPLCRVRVEFDD